MQHTPPSRAAAQHVTEGCCGPPAAGLYCATRPTIQDCSSVRFSCWMGAYPTLSGHFAAANLDPQSNMWDKVQPAHVPLPIDLQPSSYP